MCKKKISISFFLHNSGCELLFKSANFECFSEVWYVLFGQFSNFWCTTFFREYIEANFSISLTIFEVMNLIILKDMPSWKEMKSDLLKTNKNYIQNITKSINIFISEPSLKFRIVQKKITIVFFCTILDVSYFSKVQILSGLVKFGMYFLVDLGTFDVPHFYESILKLISVFHYQFLKSWIW